jgi:hypothetical protein
VSLVVCLIGQQGGHQQKGMLLSIPMESKQQSEQKQVDFLLKLAWKVRANVNSK